MGGSQPRRGAGKGQEDFGSVVLRGPAHPRDRSEVRGENGAVDGVRGLQNLSQPTFHYIIDYRAVNIKPSCTFPDSSGGGGC